MNTDTHKAILHTAFTTGQKDSSVIEAKFHRNISHMIAEPEPWFKNVPSGSRDFARIRAFALFNPILNEIIAERQARPAQPYHSETLIRQYAETLRHDVSRPDGLAHAGYQVDKVLLTGATGYIHQILRYLIGIGFLPAALSKSSNMEAVSWNG
ncbi:hypothetical protein [Xenorhabdus griffiniae]|uniref:Uncharacterized protein n=1 Tax=Xenorhabdus griffiniae TaxID=351672 RepID=A0ABY9XIY0_9GAMM|nr:hypothetical protein [Xenorhabdus griffiniae]MBD1227677.1 hypothetical protein [Xenorhabdus griffiniae]MBE8587451.1 hypothetical protein [Xenorhabdus griffiniae]WMV72846.1 hypothetical protein QL128_01940 [Xenorhabdus griffiniae]WNH02525.1 hypothetical protein QL112_001945 [Xenorhabdus griffiniae]